MAEFGPDLEDGESYLPSGILVLEDAFVAGGGGGADDPERRRQLLQRQSFFSDGVGGLPCYPPELARASLELPPSVMVTRGGRRMIGAQNQRLGGSFPASRLHFQDGLDRTCFYDAVPPQAAPGLGNIISNTSPTIGRVVRSPDSGVHDVGSGFLYPIQAAKPAFAQAGNCAKMAQRQAPARFCSGRVPRYGGTGVFLPLPRHEDECRKSRGKGGAVAHRQENRHHKAGGVAKQGVPLQGRREIGLPRDWTY